MSKIDYNKKYPDRRRRNVVKYNKSVRCATLTILGNKCVKCGFDDARALQIDHINGGGVRELKKVNGASYWNQVIKSVLNKENKFQLLCANCNWIKRSENKEAIGRPLNVKKI